MWTTMVLLGLAVILEPARTALVVLMLSRPRPMLQLATFIASGFAAHIAMGLLVLFVFRATPKSGRPGWTMAEVHIAMGVIALFLALVVAVNVTGRVRSRPAPVGAATDTGRNVAVLNETPPNAFVKRVTQLRRLATGNSLWVAGASGLANLPSYNYIAALAVILASGAAPGAQIQALLIFNIVAFTVLGLPLITYAAAPRKTRAFTVRLHAWFRARRRVQVVAIIVAAGCAMLALGFNGI